MDQKPLSLRCDPQSNIQLRCGLGPCVITPASGRTWPVTFPSCSHRMLNYNIRLGSPKGLDGVYLHPKQPTSSGERDRERAKGREI